MLVEEVLERFVAGEVGLEAVQEEVRVWVANEVTGNRVHEDGVVDAVRCQVGDTKASHDMVCGYGVREERSEGYGWWTAKEWNFVGV